jgi:hypothetical protein
VRLKEKDMQLFRLTERNKELAKLITVVNLIKNKKR